MKRFADFVFDWLLPFVIVCALLGMLQGCAVDNRPQLPTTPALPAPFDSVRSIQSIGVDSAFVEFFSTQRSNQKVEGVQCLYGVVRGDTATVVFSRPAKTLQATGAWVMFQGCPEPLGSIFGELRYLGTWHAHVGGIDCGYSLPDNRSFYEDKRNLIELVSCSAGLISRVK